MDGVIGEFDDGLTSSAESEANHRRSGQTRTNGRPGDGARTNQRAGQGRGLTNQRPGEDKVRPELRSSHLSINEQIDDIFSQLTEEIYLDEKKIKENKIKLSRSPTRNRNDPLPPPPTGESKQPPPPIDRKKKPFSPSKSSKLSSKYQDNKTLTTDKPRSKSSGARADRQNHSLPHDRSGGGEVILYEDHDFSNNTIEKVVADVHKTADYSKRAQVPPPMPEKQKIHLKNSIDRNRDTSKSFAERQKTNLSTQEAAVIEELKAKVTDKQGKISKFDNNSRQQRGRSKQRDDVGNKRPGKRPQQTRDTRASPRGNRVSSPQSSSQYVSMTDNRPQRRASNNREDYRRSKSMGPLESRDLSSPRHMQRGHSPERHVSSGDRSRYNKTRQVTQDRSRSNARNSRHESFNIDRRRDERDMFDDRRDARRGRSQVRAGHVTGGHLMSPPSPAEAEETIAKLLPRYCHVCHVWYHWSHVSGVPGISGITGVMSSPAVCNMATAELILCCSDTLCHT